MKLGNSVCEIEICVDRTYTLESVDNKAYDLLINPSNLKRSDFYKVFYIHINLFYITISIALVGDLYSYDAECAVLENDVLTVLQNDAIIQINVNDGSLLSYKKIDSFGCNFAIHKINIGYIIYGEIEISMLDFQLNKKWTFSGRDIFVSTSGKRSFVLCENSIQLYDFDDNFYEINFEGQLLSDK